VTITDLAPAVFHRTERKHRAKDTIRRLRRELRDLSDKLRAADARQRAADDFFARLLTDRRHLYGAWQFAEQKRQEAEQVAMCALEETAALNSEVAELRAQLAPFLAAEANAHRVDVPPMVRDTSDPADQSTGPIDVRALWQARDAGLLGPVTDPGHVSAT
jgi:hypothetical protein